MNILLSFSIIFYKQKKLKNYEYTTFFLDMFEAENNQNVYRCPWLPILRSAPNRKPREKVYTS